MTSSGSPREGSGPCSVLWWQLEPRPGFVGLDLRGGCSPGDVPWPSLGRAQEGEVLVARQCPGTVSALLSAPKLHKVWAHGVFCTLFFR